MIATKIETLYTWDELPVPVRARVTREADAPSLAAGDPFRTWYRIDGSRSERRTCSSLLAAGYYYEDGRPSDLQVRATPFVYGSWEIWPEDPSLRNQDDGQVVLLGGAEVPLLAALVTSDGYSVPECDLLWRLGPLQPGIDPRAHLAAIFGSLRERFEAVGWADLLRTHVGPDNEVYYSFAG